MAKPKNTVFGLWDRINDTIYSQGRTKKDVAEQCGFDRKILHSYGNMSLVYFTRLCSALNVSADYLLFDKNFPIMIWHDFVVDGHNRYDICLKHKIDFVYGTLGYKTKEEVMEWMLDIQLGRRNLSPIQRIAIAEKYRSIYEKDAQKRLEEGRIKGGQIKSNSSTQNFVESKTSTNRSENETNAKLAKIANVNRETYRQAKRVLDSDNEDLKQRVLSGETAISTGYKELVWEERGLGYG